MKLRLATYNIHKGFSHFNRRMMVHELRHHLRLLDVDIVFLQEVQGEHEDHAEHIRNWPAEPQYEFLADEGLGVRRNIHGRKPAFAARISGAWRCVQPRN